MNRKWKVTNELIEIEKDLQYRYFRKTLGEIEEEHFTLTTTTGSQVTRNVKYVDCCSAFVHNWQ